VASYVSLIRGKTNCLGRLNLRDLLGSKQDRYVFYGILRSGKDVRCKYKIYIRQ